MEKETPDQMTRIAREISMSPSTYEKIYLSPPNSDTRELRKAFANPTPLCLLGFIMSLGPLSCDLMGWRGAGGNGSSSIGVFFFMGGLLMIIGGVGEFILGNSYPFIVFCGFGGWWLSFGATLKPSFGAYGNYSPDPTDPAAGLSTTGFLAGFGMSSYREDGVSPFFTWRVFEEHIRLTFGVLFLGFFLLFMALFCLVCLICALKLNICLVIIHSTLVICFCLLTGSFWHSAEAGTEVASKLLIAGGAFGFVSAAAAGYLFLSQMLLTVEFPVSLPVGDLSSLFARHQNQIKGKAQGVDP
ncbi:hypothetical protein AYO21_08867 [Fonsecaea monophora]|uniref:Protein alcS n=1 Tax=Fonsecaea monophora TaxID=254056 RepID=A0A177EZA3_9EURO|nr:hypothetical protein AYO21_08867 [Fonsecaea monophora]KAH0827696.1 Protein alcS [Fonsecaea pedrosoi]OAG36906.1 hypothetical protein AYO21_08867 [Fonsecaea monophora]